MAYKGKDGKEYEYQPVDYHDGTDVGADGLFLSPESQTIVQAFKNTWAEGDKKYKAAQAAGDQAGMDQAQKIMDNAHAGAEAERAKAGYQGGANGGAYNPLAGASAAGSAKSFSYEEPPSYENGYQQQQIEDMYQQILGRKDFQYDPESDPLYAQYKEQYTRNGERAMEDTLGQVSARTGGLASTYAGSAAQGSYNQYMAGLNDVIPQLEQLAWERYRAEGQDQRADLELLMALEQRDYGRYLDQLGQYNADRSFAYGVDRDQREFDYRLSRDQVADQQYKDEVAYRAAQDQYNQDLLVGQQMANVGDYGKLGELWKLSDEDIQRLTEKYLEDQRRLNDEEARGTADWYAGYGDPSKLEEMGVDTTALKRQWGIGEEPWSYGGGGEPTPPTPKSGYDNGGLDSEQVKELQSFLNKRDGLDLSVDGFWGPESQKAANGMSADDAWGQYAHVQRVEDGTNSAYESIMREISDIEDRDLGEGEKVGLIIQTLQNAQGKLNDTDVKMILAQYGITV